jgi:phospholipid/cholesterol/gamma-HCH transport system substrate-binding protein
MDRAKIIEVTVGIFVAGGLAALFVLAMKVSNLSTFTDDEGYELIARFDNVGGLKVRSPVSVAGVRVGRVGGIDYDNTTFEAVDRMRIGKRYDQFPEDTSAQIYTAGLLGEQYVALEPGGAEALLGDGDTIGLTQSALVLEQIIGQFLYSKASQEADQAGAE